MGLDGGGTKTRCLVATLEGQPLGRGQGGPSNYLSEGLDRARKSLEDSVLGALSSAGADGTEIACLCAGLVSALEDLGLGEWYRRLPEGLDTKLAVGGRSLSAGEGQLPKLRR